MRNRKEILTLAAVRALQAVLADMQVLAEPLEDNVDTFAHDQRNFGAQQVRPSLIYSLQCCDNDICFIGYDPARSEELEWSDTY